MSSEIVPLLSKWQCAYLPASLITEKNCLFVRQRCDLMLLIEKADIYLIIHYTLLTKRENDVNSSLTS